jgi:hypothetical protein
MPAPWFASFWIHIPRKLKFPPPPKYQLFTYKKWNKSQDSIGGYRSSHKSGTVMDWRTWRQTHPNVTLSWTQPYTKCLSYGVNDQKLIMLVVQSYCAHHNTTSLLRWCNIKKWSSYVQNTPSFNIPTREKQQLWQIMKRLFSNLQIKILTCFQFWFHIYFQIYELQQKA